MFKKQPATAAREPIRGAVRINPAARNQAAMDAPRFSRTAKLSTALVVVAGGILWTTTSTGTDVLKSAVALAAPSVIEPAIKLASAAADSPVIVQASMPATTFFFDDAVDALTAHFSSESVATVNDRNAQSLDIQADSVHPTATQVAFVTGNIVPEPAPDAGVAGRQHPDELDTVLDQDSAAIALNSQFDFPGKLHDTPVENSGKSSALTKSPLLDHPSLAAVRNNATAPAGALRTVVSVAPGNTLSGILNSHGVKVEQMPRLLTDDIVKQYLSNLKIGQQLDIYQMPDGDFHSLSVRVGDDKRITIRRSTNDFAIASIDLPVEKERVVTSGTIEQSLYLAAEEAHLKQSTIMELADIFQWELDFAKDIRKGDQFSLVYDRLYRDGSYIGDGDILAAEFVRGGKTYRAIRFTTDDGVTAYYSPEGKPKRRAFMRHPVDVARITSKFNPKRLHPVLHQIRAHRGVDYGAPYGSPIYATADGKVSFAGDNGAYGNTVILQHGRKFSTLYAHMSKISDKSVVGKRIKQGEVIGYVGKSGRVTGTHLHYEFRVNNQQIDPLMVELPSALPIDRKYLPELRAVSDDMTAQMRSVLPDTHEQVASMTDNQFTVVTPVQE
jgi:murein DD-endopeptidase MepM/ murein hydrolase activator NlpD